MLLICHHLKRIADDPGGKDNVAGDQFKLLHPAVDLCEFKQLLIKKKKPPGVPVDQFEPGPVVFPGFFKKLFRRTQHQRQRCSELM